MFAALTVGYLALISNTPSCPQPDAMAWVLSPYGLGQLDDLLGKPPKAPTRPTVLGFHGGVWGALHLSLQAPPEVAPKLARGLTRVLGTVPHRGKFKNSNPGVFHVNGKAYTYDPCVASYAVAGRAHVSQIYAWLRKQPGGVELSDWLMHVGLGGLRELEFSAAPKGKTLFGVGKMTGKLDGLFTSLEPVTTPARSSNHDFARVHVNLRDAWLQIEKLAAVSQPLNYTLARAQLAAAENDTKTSLLDDVIGEGKGFVTLWRTRAGHVWTVPLKGPRGLAKLSTHMALLAKALGYPVSIEQKNSKGRAWLVINIPSRQTTYIALGKGHIAIAASQQLAQRFAREKLPSVGAVSGGLVVAHGQVLLPGTRLQWEARPEASSPEIHVQWSKR